jgi:bacterioferritin-associated ferredoxin
VIVCSCHAVSDQALLSAVAAGATAEEALRATGAGSDCGCCHSQLEELLAAEGTEGCCGGPCEACPRRGKA